MADQPAAGRRLPVRPAPTESARHRRDTVPAGRRVPVPALGLAGVDDDPLETHIVRGID